MYRLCMNRRNNPEGFRNSNDRDDHPTFHDVEKEIIDELNARQIRVHFDTANLDPESKKILAQWTAELRACLQRWKESIGDVMHNDGRISLRMKEYLEKHGLDLPTFDMYEKKEADALLATFGFAEEHITKGNFLVVFNLPKPLSQFWWKGGVELWGSGSKDTRSMVVEWGRVYRLMIPVIWDLRDQHESNMERINPIEVHDPKRFYYLWELGNAPMHRHNTVDADEDDVLPETPPERLDW